MQFDGIAITGLHPLQPPPTILLIGPTSSDTPLFPLHHGAELVVLEGGRGTVEEPTLLGRPENLFEMELLAGIGDVDDSVGFEVSDSVFEGS